MSATRAGGLKAAATNKARYGVAYYRNLALLSAASRKRNGTPTGFALDLARAKTCGSKGGSKSKRGPAQATHCVNGHAYTKSNTYIAPGSKHRSCRECRSLRALKQRLERIARTVETV